MVAVEHQPGETDAPHDVRDGVLASQGTPFGGAPAVADGLAAVGEEQAGDAVARLSTPDGEVVPILIWYTVGRRKGRPWRRSLDCLEVARG